MALFNTPSLALAAALTLAACSTPPAVQAPTVPAASAQPTARAATLPGFEPVPARHRASPLPPDWKHGAFMEIHVRAYQDSDGDGHGDLRGLISRLDYLKDLGITGLWLMPVMDSQDKDHGYATQNYRAIESDYGTLADFDELLKQAHARGIGIVIDYLINHSAAEHPAFVAASASRTSPWRDFYLWQDHHPAGWKIYGQDPWYDTDHGSYFAGFWNQMPDFNLKNPAVRAWHHDNLRFWLNRGVDGFRFDAVGNLVENGPEAWEVQPENDAVMAEIRRVVMAYPNRYMVCESPGAPKNFAAPEVCGASFAFTQNFNVVGAAAGDDVSLQDAAEYFKNAPASMATFASNHDSFAGDRLWDQLEGDATQVRLAAATYLLLPGTPFVYYGEEVGMSSAPSLKGDPRLRTPMSWTADPRTAGFTTGEPFRALAGNAAKNNVASQIADPASLRNFYRAVIALRKASPALMRGRYVAPQVQGLTFSFQRSTPGHAPALVVFNYGRKAAEVAVGALPPGARLLRRWPQGGADIAANAGGHAQVALPAQAFAVFEVAP